MKRGDCVVVFKNKDHIVMAATGIHPGNILSRVNPVILGLFVCRVCFIEKVLLFTGKSVSTCHITLHMGKEWIVFVCGYGTNEGNLEPC